MCTKKRSGEKEKRERERRVFTWNKKWRYQQNELMC